MKGEFGEDEVKVNGMAAPISIARKEGRRPIFLRRLKIAILVGLPAAGLILVLFIEHRPTWYRPVEHNRISLDEARGRAAQLVDSISDAVVLGESFDLRITDALANAWLATALHDRPDLFARIPDEFKQPAIGFRDDCVQFGAKFERNGWRAILSARVGVTVSADGSELSVSVQRISIGSLPLPRWLWPISKQNNKGLELNGAADLTKSPLLDLEAPSPENSNKLDWRQLGKGLRIRNRFIWPNGRRPFRIAAATATNGVLLVRIEPL